MTDMHELLIRANLALFQGERHEVQRLLAEYHALGEDTGGQAGLLRWLEAQSQADQEERLRLLRGLAERGDTTDHYTVMAQSYLADEVLYTGLAKRQRMMPPVRRWLQAAALLLICAVVVGGLVIWGGLGGDGAALEATATPLIITEMPVVALPDRSEQLVGADLRVQYDGGILQLRAVEDRSERVFDGQTAQPVMPVPGARFYALEAVFECRSSICNMPPEAEISLLTDGGEFTPARSDVYIFGAERMAPVALGRTTTGWLIFELPVVFQPRMVEVKPILPDNTRGEPVFITLPPGA